MSVEDLEMAVIDDIAKRAIRRLDEALVQCSTAGKRGVRGRVGSVVAAALKASRMALPEGAPLPPIPPSLQGKAIYGRMPIAIDESLDMAVIVDADDGTPFIVEDDAP